MMSIIVLTRVSRALCFIAYPPPGAAHMPGKALLPRIEQRQPALDANHARDGGRLRQRTTQENRRTTLLSAQHQKAPCQSRSGVPDRHQDPQQQTQGPCPPREALPQGPSSPPAVSQADPRTRQSTIKRPRIAVTEIAKVATARGGE